MLIHTYIKTHDKELEINLVHMFKYTYQPLYGPCGPKGKDIGRGILDITAH